ncbi:ABC transporter permease [Ahrensia sp. R2A130]|uniref:ABC transporter permease n=1 Tax=Ahrensia sp. R2A130 TaxID=744979 RepID=UPI0001E0F0AC|nr:ABC transporter permease subunit [Ahrensia sp. R2A130]EFL89915.1 ABC transporter permease [Ahrensia sp. R2A130]
MLRLAPALALVVLLGPVACGLIATLLPAFGYLPALGGDHFTTSHFHEVLHVGGMERSLWLSYFTGLATTLIAFVIVWLFVAGWNGTAMFARMQHLISPLLSVPHAAAAFGLVFLIAPSGMLLRLLSPWATGFDRPPDWLLLQDPNGIALIAGLVMKEIPFLLLVTLAALPQTPAAQAARVANSMGYGRIAGFTFTTWPLVYRQIRLAVFAVIAFATSTVDVALVLGPATPPTLAVKLTQWMSDPDIAMRFAACAGAVLQLGVTVAAILTWVVGEKIAAAVVKMLRNSGHRFVRDAALRTAGAALTGMAALTVFAGLALLALWSVAGFWSFPDALPGSFNLRTWERTLPQLAGPLGTTLATGLIATAIAVVLTLACLEREARTGRTGGNRALLFIYIPLLIPQVAFVFGLQLFFLGLGWDASFPALVFVHLIFVLPYVFLALSDPWRAFDKRFVWVAAGLGQSPVRTFWRVRFPMLLKPVLVAAAVGLAVSIGQYLPTLLIGAGRWPTVTTEAVALASGGNRRVIGVMAFMQMVLPFVGFALAAAIPALLFRNRRDMGVAA